MQLYGSTRSPFSRKVRIAVHELDLGARIDFVPVVVSQTGSDPALLRLNPLGQIPTLVLDDGRVLHDSLVICEYLNRLAGGSLVPADGDARWETLARHATGQGMLETLVKLFAERKRTADPLSGSYTEAFRVKAFRPLSLLDAHYARIRRGFDLGDIAVACALSYADFRFAHFPWRGAHPALQAWFEAVSARPSMHASSLSGEPAAVAGP